jgi:predicted RNA-binding protein with PUA-like domain
MAYWLLKTEPDEFSWDDQVKGGAKGELWTGVRNFTARRHLKEMKKGDQAFFYHTGDEKQVVGIVEIIRENHPDPTAEKGEPWVVVDTRVKYGRLSVQPVTPEHWKAICKMGGLK